MYKPGLFISISSAMLFITLSFLPAESFISYLEGAVTVSRGLETIEGDLGLKLFKGDVIQTGENSLAILEVEGRGILKMRDETIIALDNLGEKMAVSLKAGGLFSRIKKLLGLEYEVHTPDMVAGVRGTVFFVAYGLTIEDTPDLWLCVNEGAVEVSVRNNSDTIMVKEGEGIIIPAGSRLTQPQFYRWTENLNWNTDPEKGDIRDQTELNTAYGDLRNFDYD